MAKAKQRQRDKTPVVTIEPSVCGKCHSTERDPYHWVRELSYGGVTPAGRAYTHVVWRRTRCRGCGQVRDDKTFETRV